MRTIVMLVFSTMPAPSPDFDIMLRSLTPALDGGGGDAGMSYVLKSFRVSCLVGLERRTERQRAGKKESKMSKMYKMSKM